MAQLPRWRPKLRASHRRGRSGDEMRVACRNGVRVELRLLLLLSFSTGVLTLRVAR